MIILTKVATDGQLPLIRNPFTSSEKLIIIGASTGGVQALETVLKTFPPNAPGTVVVQHMPARFTASFAQRLDGLVQIGAVHAE